MACLDTNVIVDFVKGDESIIDLVTSYAKKEGLSTTVITEYEILKYNNATIRDLCEKFIDAIKIHEFDRAAAREASGVFRVLRATGKMINENDILIAGLVASKNETLITRDKDFTKVEGGRVIFI